MSTPIALVATGEPSEEHVNAWRRLMRATIGRLLYRWMTANAVTFSGFAISLIAFAYFSLTYRPHSWTVLLVPLTVAVFAGILDGADGAVAYLRIERLGEKKSERGEFLDSGLDRLNECAMWLALIYAMPLIKPNVMVAAAAIAGSLCVTYFRAKAEKQRAAYKMGDDSKWYRLSLVFYAGDRMGRLIVTAVMVAISPWIGLQWVGYAVSAVAWPTAFSRFLIAYRGLEERDNRRKNRRLK